MRRKLLCFCWRLCSSLVLAGLLLLPGGDTAVAHANLVRSEPAAGAVLSGTPEVLVFEYSEPLDPALAAVTLLDGNAEVVIDDGGTIDAARPDVLRLSLPPLAEGTYSAVWRVRSAVDGHTTNGTVAFSVGLSSPRASLLPPPGTPAPALALPTLTETMWRWLNYLTAVVAAGSLLFAVLVWRPAYQRWPERNEDSDSHASSLIRRLSLMAIGGLILATCGFALAQAVQVGSAPGVRLAMLLGVRLGLLLILAWLVWRLPLAGSGSGGRWQVASMLALVVLATFSLQTHSAALEPQRAALAVFLSWIHLAATAAWLGGLAPLALLLTTMTTKSNLWRQLIPRFSLVAVVSVLVLAVTGVYSALIHVQTIEALAATSYGRMLLAKTGLFVVLLGLGAINLVVLSPRLNGAGHLAAGWLRRTVRTELALGGLVLLTVGVLTGVSPAFEALQAQRRQGFVERVQLNDVEMTLRIAPAQVGENEFGVDIFDRRPDVAEATPEVFLRFRPPDQAMGLLQVETTTLDQTRFTAHGTYLSVPGEWQVLVILRRPGFDDVTYTFRVLV